MADDLRLQLVVQAILDAKGFDEAKASIAGLAEAANRAAPANKKLSDATDDLSESQEVSSREIKILTREMLMSVGASQGAASAGRLAAFSFAAIGNSAQLANLALAGFGFGLAFLLPRLIEWVQQTDTVSKESHALIGTLQGLSQSMSALLRDVPALNEKYGSLTKTLHDLAMQNEAIQAQAMRKAIEEMTVELDKVGPKQSAWLTLMQLTNPQAMAFAQGMDKDAKAAGELRTQIAAASAAVTLHNEAVQKGLTLEEMIQADHPKHVAALHQKKEAVDKITEAWEKEVKARDRAGEEDEQFVLQLLRDREREAKEEKRLNDEKAKEEQRLAKLVEEDERREAAAREANKNATISYIGQTATALSSAFGHNKALAIAGAIVDTWAGAARALGPEGPPWPANIAAAAMVAAVGLAEVANIEKANPGFDDPMNDIIAERLGRKSAQDFVRLFGGGFHSGLVGMNGGNSISNTTINRGVTVQSLSMSGVLAGTEEQMLVKLNRKLNTIAARHEKRTTLGR